MRERTVLPRSIEELTTSGAATSVKVTLIVVTALVAAREPGPRAMTRNCVPLSSNPKFGGVKLLAAELVKGVEEACAAVPGTLVKPDRKSTRLNSSHVSESRM